jgi:hypothetical protein
VSFSRLLSTVISGSKPLAGVRPMLVDQRFEPATDFIEAMSMTKRERTSLFTTRSYAREISSGRISAISALIFRAVQ